LFCILLFGSGLTAQQIADTSFLPKITNPTYTSGEGPVIKIDEAHHNFHTIDGRYMPFAKLFERDGYTVLPFQSPFSDSTLVSCDILVISNALNERNTEDWSLPTPSAFTDDEIMAVKKWVKNGGRLFLIADHMPFPGAAEKLAATFGFKFNNGFAMDPNNQGPTVFRQKDNTFRGHIIGDSIKENWLDSVASFTGQAFQCDGCEPLLIFDSGYVSLMPQTAWEFDDRTPTVNIEGWYQGAIQKYGKGRLAVFGEAAMFTAQIANGHQAGMNSPIAGQNLQFLLDLMHWLSK